MIDERVAEAVRRLTASFDADADALDRCARILRLQWESLVELPPAESLPDSVRLAATARVREGEVVMPRERFPLEAGRVGELLRRLVAELVTESPRLPPHLASAVMPALDAARLDDGERLLEVAHDLELGPSAGPALLREALKPELLRVSRPFLHLLAESRGVGGQCPLCGTAASTGTLDDTACCGFCGVTWPLRADACVQCGGTRLIAQDLTQLVTGARFTGCRDCGHVLKQFTAEAEPLLLSMHAVLAAPFELAAQRAVGAEPKRGMTVF